MKKSDQLQRLKSVQKKIEQAGNGAYVEVTPEEMLSMKGDADQPPDAAGPPPGFYSMGDQAQSMPIEAEKSPQDATLPPLNPDAPLTPLEAEYASNPSLMVIYGENPSEIPPRIRARIERQIELRKEMTGSNPWSWMNF